MGDEPARRVQASAEVGEVSYPIAVARGGDYRVRLLLAGIPPRKRKRRSGRSARTSPRRSSPCPSRRRPPGPTRAACTSTPERYSATVLLPKGASLEYVELAPPCLNPIEPLGGWKGQAVATTGDVAVTALKAIDLEHELPPSDTALEIPAGRDQGRGRHRRARSELRCRARARGAVAEGRARRVSTPRSSSTWPRAGFTACPSSASPAAACASPPTPAGSRCSAPSLRPPRARTGDRCSRASSGRDATSSP